MVVGEEQVFASLDRCRTLAYLSGFALSCVDLELDVVWYLTTGRLNCK
jgi:hypothetical protein